MFQSAKNWSDKGEYDQAIKDYSQAIKLTPGDAAAWFNRGNSYADKGEYDQAIKDYSQTIKLAPDDADAWINRSDAYLRKGEYDQVIKDCREAIKLAPDDAYAWYNRGAAYFNKGDYDQAIKDYSEVIKLEPDDADAWRNRGNAYLKLGNEAKAKIDFLKAEELESKAVSNVSDPTPKIRALEKQVGVFELQYSKVRKLIDEGKPDAGDSSKVLDNQVQKWLVEWDKIMESYRDTDGYLKPEYKGYNLSRRRVSKIRYELNKSKGFFDD